MEKAFFKDFVSQLKMPRLPVYNIHLLMEKKTIRAFKDKNKTNLMGN